jgi:salicylate hydroxylase
MAELLAEELLQSSKDLEAVFAAFDTSRKKRGQWLVQSSRRIGDCYEWRAEGVGNDFKKIEAEINERNGIIANVDLTEMCAQAREELGRKLK